MLRLLGWRVPLYRPFMVAARFTATTTGTTPTAAAIDLAATLPPGVFDALSVVVPSDSFIPITDAYAALSATERTAIRKSPFRQLGKMLAAVPTEFEVSGDGLFVRRLGGVDAVRVSVAPPKPVNVVVTPEPSKPKPKPAPAQQNSAKRVPVVLAVKSGGKVKYVDVGQEAVSGIATFTPPPPPPDNPVGTTGKPDNYQPGTAAGNTGDDGTTLSTQMMAAFLPTYFVPMDEVVPTLPEGYTAAHIEQLFSSTNAIQIVNVLGKQFARFIGGYRNHRNVNLLDDEYASAVDAFFTKYRPDPDALMPFLNRLEPKGDWKALFHVVTGVQDPAAVAKLGFEGPLTLLYFAQMQHIVAFSPANGGGLCVPMRPVTTLTWETSPVPRSCHGVWRILEGSNATPLESLWTLLPDLVKEELLAYFGPQSVSAKVEATGGVAMTKQRGWVANAAPVANPLPVPRAPGVYNDDVDGQDEGDAVPLTPGRGWGDAASANTAHDKAATTQSSGSYDGPSEGAAGQATANSSDTATAEPGEGGDDGVGASSSSPRQGTDSDEDGGGSDEDSNDPDLVSSSPSPSPSSARDDAARPDTPEEATLRRFINCHGAMFALRNRLALLAFEVSAYERQNMSLEEQLNMALERNNNTLARKIKRKMTILSQPDNPLLDEANLAKAIAGFLPPDRPLPWKYLKTVLPAEVLDLIPIKRGKKFFESYPELFKVYEVHHAGRKVIQRGDLPPPDGVLRGEGAFTEDELVRIVAQELAMRPRSVSALLSRLSMGVERTLTKKYGGVAQFCQKYPQHFSVVVKDAKNNDLRTAILTLLSPPSDAPVEEHSPQL